MWAPVYNVSNILILKKLVFGLAQIRFSPGSSGASCFSLGRQGVSVDTIADVGWG